MFLVSPLSIGLRAGNDGFVYHREVPLSLPPKEQAVLHLLISQWPKAVEKSLFADIAWGGRGMSDESLARCVAALRRALAPMSRLRISSVYRFGYQLQILDESQADARPPVGHLRMHEAAKGAPPLAESVIFAGQLISQRTVSSLRRAETVLRSVIAQNDQFMAARIAIANCLAAQLSVGLREGQATVDEALEFLSVVEREAPQTPGLRSQYAHLLDCAWRFDEAHSQHQQALADDPEDSDTLYHYGWHLLATGSTKAALAVLGRAAAQNPFSLAGAILCAYALMAGGQLDEAEALLHDQCLKHPDSVAAQVCRLALQALIGPKPELLQAADAFLLDASSWPFGAATLAYVRARCGDHAGAQRLLAQQAQVGATLRAAHMPALLVMGCIDEAANVAACAVQFGCGALPILLQLPEAAALRDHPRFAEVAAQVYRRSVSMDNGRTP
ncbi:MAG: tetratricopeptide repeat protein [Burkholderiales bacterium]|mgnify:CR=1 FL=1|nr:tetratricopeptide repeat protein [Burkholderiales bacterium]